MVLGELVNDGFSKLLAEDGPEDPADAGPHIRGVEGLVVPVVGADEYFHAVVVDDDEPSVLQLVDGCSELPGSPVGGVADEPPWRVVGDSDVVALP